MRSQRVSATKYKPLDEVKNECKIKEKHSCWIACVVLAGFGGFAIFWFVVKKKKIADLIAIFKKK